MTFEHPLPFAALPLLALWVGWLEWRLPGNRTRRVLRGSCRLLLLTLVIAALAGPYERATSDVAPQVVIATDRANRLSAAAVAEGEALARAVEAAAQRAGVAVTRIGFTTRAAAPGEEPPASRRSAAAAGLAGARFALGGRETGGIFLISDGRGDLSGVPAAARALREDGIVVSAQAVPSSVPARQASPQIEALDLPEIARGPFLVRARVTLPDATPDVRLQLLVDGVRTHALDPNTATGQEVVFEELDLAPGLHEITLLLESLDEGSPETLDQRRAVVEVGAPPRVGVLLQSGGRSPWRRALQGQGLDLSETRPEDLAALLSQGDALPDLIVADPLSLVALPPAAALMLAEQVQAGLGLVVEAGEDDEAWARLGTGPLADLLPVAPQATPKPPPPPPPPPQAEPEPDIEPPEPDEGPGLKAERRPEKALPISLLIVIDRSPSMEGAKFEMALEGARRAALALSPWDRIGIITFAKDATLDVPIRSARLAHTRLRMWLSTLRTGGETTNIVRALQLAAQTFERERSPILHLLLLTDGRQYPPGPIFGPVVKPMRRRGITITAVGIGSGASMRDLRDIVQWAASGMVVPVANETDLPTILTEDTERLARDRKDKAEKLDARLRPEEQEASSEEPETGDEAPDIPAPLPPVEEPLKEPAPPLETEEAEEERLPLRQVRRHEALAGIEEKDLPEVGAPRRAVLQPGAALLLEREGGAPVLSAMRGGLGRVLVWALPPDDAGSLAWTALGRLHAQSARAVMAPRGALGYLPSAQVSQGSDGAFLRVAWPAGTSSGRLRARWIGPKDESVDLGLFTPEESAGRALPGAPADALCRIEMSVPGGPPLPPLSYAVARAGEVVPLPGDAQALERVLDAPLLSPTAFVDSLRSRTLPGRVPRWPWFLWAALALLPIDVWLHRRSRPA